MKPKQEEALRDYLRESIVPLIEDVLIKKLGQAITFAKEELAAPVQEPFAWCIESEDSADWCFAKTEEGVKSNSVLMDEDCIKTKPFPLYTTPPQRTWEPVETAPKDGTDVLLMYMHIDTQVVHNGFWIGASDADDESEIGWWSYDYSEVTRIKLDDWMNPTHWLPLPKLKEKNT